MFIGALILTLAGAKAAQILFRGRLRAFSETSETRIDDILLATFEKPIYWIVLAGGFGLSLGMLSLPGGLEIVVGHVITLMVIHVLRLESLQPGGCAPVDLRRPDDREERVPIRRPDRAIVEKGVKVTIWAFAILIAFDNVGFDVVSLVTGLGIGGIALAMAAKDTLANFFGSLTVFTDQPFQVGDLISLKGQTGTVKEIRPPYLPPQDPSRARWLRFQTRSWSAIWSRTSRRGKRGSSPGPSAWSTKQRADSSMLPWPLWRRSSPQMKRSATTSPSSSGTSATPPWRSPSSTGFSHRTTSSRSCPM